MRRRLVLAWLSLGLVLWPGNHGARSAPAGAGPPPWQTDVATARRLARLSGKPIFAVFR